VNQQMTIVFMGTPEFSVPSLEALVHSGYHILLAVTQPDRPKGRGRKVSIPPVKIAAGRLGIEILQPSSIKSHEIFDRIHRLKPDALVVVAFGQILPNPFLCSPRIGAVNIHASLLPKYRGPAPIQWALINGEKETGITSIRMDEGLDTGDILMSTRVSILPDDTSATLHDRLAKIGADILIQTLKGLERGRITPIPQDHSRATYAPMLRKEDGRIDWRLPAPKIEAFIRGMTPWPQAFTFHEKKQLKILRAKALSIDEKAPPGTVIRGFADELRIAAGDGVISVVEIQGPSGKRLKTEDFLRGYRLPVGTVLR